MSDEQPPTAREIISHLALSGSCASFAEFVTIPLNTAKVRLQILNRSGQNPAVSGSIPMIRDIYRNEGGFALFKGIEAGIHRQFIFAGIRVGLYEHVLNFFSGGKPKEEASVWERTQAAATTSAIGITVANPSDVVKVQTQAHIAGPSHTHNPMYKGPAFDVYRHIINTQGVMGGLYAAYLPNLVRNTIISSAELVTYDVSKSSYRTHWGVPEGALLHCAAGLSAGFVATVLGSPIDVVSTRIMVLKGKGINKTMFETCSEMAMKEGLSSFYQGFGPNFLRIGSFNVVMWMTVEKLKSLMS